MRLAKEAQLCAYAAIERDPSSDVAHHLMGRLVAGGWGRRRSVQGGAAGALGCSPARVAPAAGRVMHSATRCCALALAPVGGAPFVWGTLPGGVL